MEHTDYTTGSTWDRDLRAVEDREEAEERKAQRRVVINWPTEDGPD